MQQRYGGAAYGVYRARHLAPRRHGHGSVLVLREQRVQEALASSDDARFSVRARELALTADVTAAYLTLTTAEKTAAIQEQNSAKAKLELKFAQDRYRTGSVTLVDVTDARAAYERAESDRINAIYDYHKAYAALESAVGRPLR